MLSKYRKKFVSLTLSVITLSAINAHASPAQHHIVVVPQCLTHYLSAPHKTIATLNSFSLIDVNDAGLNQLIKGKENKKVLCGGFMNVSEAWDNYAARHVTTNKSSALFLNKYIQSHTKTYAAASKQSYDVKYPAQVNQLLNQVNPQRMWDNLVYLSSMKDRYANSQNGVAAAEWFKEQIEHIAKTHNRNDVTVTTVATGVRYKQPSVVVKVGNSDQPGIVIGAHMDTLNSTYERMPGADDDGSGSVTVLETAQTILASGMTFKKPIYFIWYAAEEMGLVGSGYVVSEFKNKKIPVDAVMHFDLTGYAYRNETTMWLMDDYVNTKLVSYLEKLIQTYVGRPVKHSRCGYACSDHASWFQAGYVTGMPAEAAYNDSNPYMHSSDDTTDHLSLAHMTDYLKLATAFVVEMAEPNA